jgi:hypothetical protein
MKKLVFFILVLALLALPISAYQYKDENGRNMNIDFYTGGVAESESTYKTQPVISGSEIPFNSTGLLYLIQQGLSYLVNATASINVTTPEPETPTTGGGGGAVVAPTPAENITIEDRCPINESFFIRLIDDCSIDNIYCEDGESPLATPECQVNSEAINCTGVRCIFNEIWLARLALILAAITFFRFKKKYRWISYFILAFIVITYIITPSPQMVDVLTEGQDVMNYDVSIDQLERNVLLLLGSRVMPSNPIIGLAILSLILFFVVNKLRTKKDKKTRKKKK